jgi:hypothetical protein
MALAVTEAELQGILDDVAFTRSYGFRLQAIGDGECTLEVPFRTEFERPGGIVSGQVLMAAADVAISNDSGLMHIAAALGTPTMGIFGPTSPYHWAPLNGLAATVQTKTVVPCQPCHRPVCTMNDHRCMRDIPASDVVAIAQRVLAEALAGIAD